MAVLGQPGKMDMPMQQVVMGLPPALDYLKQLNRLNVRQKKEMLEILTGFETCNRYEITNTMGQQVFFAQEESSCCERMFCAYNRGFTLHITDNNSQEMIRVTREFKCCTGCCWCADGCCNMEVTIEAPVGRVVGKARTSSSYWKGHFKVYDAADTHLFTIWGPCCPCQAPCCPEDLRYPITDPSLSHEVGVVGKQWRGCCAEGCTDADLFYVEFPQDMLVDTKCLLLGTLFLVDYLEFEKQNNNNNQ